MTSHQYTRPYNPDGVIAYFISFRCYGTWFHGDERGSVHRTGNNVWKMPMKPSSPGLKEHEHAAQRAPSMWMDDAARKLVDATIRNTCELREWKLKALNVQPDHVHLVVSAPVKPEAIMNSLKSWATRRLRQAELVRSDAKVWSRHGSTRWIWTPEQLASVIGYVVHGQPWPTEWDNGFEGQNE